MQMSHTIQQYLPWFILKNVPGVGNIIYRRLIQKFGSPEDVFTASSYDLMAIRGMSEKLISAIKDPAVRSYAVVNDLKKEIDQIERGGFKILTMVETDYPALLKHIPDPPPYFTYFGTLDNRVPSIAIVGSRQATSYGLNAAERLAYDLTLKGFQVVSGLAVGIDSAAHHGALRAKGRTVAILGSGLGKIYPAANRALFYKIADSGAVISEFKVDSEPEGRHFPMRNRIIAGMSSGTVVVEAATKSGSLITARLAAEYNREVFAVPGNIDSFKSAGTHALLKQGAKLVENCMDVVEELRPIEYLNNVDDASPTHGVAGAQEESLFKEPDHLLQKQPMFRDNDILPFKPDQYQIAILDILKSAPLHIDTIIEQSGLDTGGITAALMDLELMGIIRHSPGKMFYKV